MKWVAVNIHNGERCDELCTRPSIYSNPYVIGKDGTRLEVLQKYRVHLHANTAIVARGRVELVDKPRLGCVCVPSACHLHILIDALENWKI